MRPDHRKYALNTLVGQSRGETADFSRRVQERSRRQESLAVPNDQH